jgi:hypothetical protein
VAEENQLRIASLGVLGALLFLMGAPGSALGAECSATAVSAPDGSALTILFDDMTVSGDGSASASCSIVAPLELPEGYSLGVYRVDYRGFAHLAKGQTAELSVDYHLGPKQNGRRFSRKVRGPLDEDFALRENIGAGLMKRVGCGTDAALNVAVALRLERPGADALATLDSSDGASRRGLVYHFNLRKCER